MEKEIRMLRKRFKCIKCGIKLSKLVASTQREVLCESCGHLATEISEEEYKNKTRDEINQNYRIIFDNKSNENNTTNDRVHPDLNDKNIHNLHGDTNKKFKSENNVNKKQGDSGINNNNENASSSRTTTNSNNSGQNNFNNNYCGSHNVNNNFNRSNSPLDRDFNQFNNKSNSGRIDNNSNNMFSNIFSNVCDSFGRAFNTFDNNNQNSNQFNNSNTSNNYRARENSNRDGFPGSANQGGFFNNFFSNNGINFPFGESPFMGRIFRHNFDEDIFDPNFEFFGSTFNNFFRDNYASNFRSNFMNGWDIGEIFETLRNQTENDKKSKTTSEKSLNKLKRFKMNAKYCKKSSKGNLEFPNCCICISDVVINEETVLLPCGHIFHCPCVLEWLKKNNTCPVCRFEL